MFISECYDQTKDNLVLPALDVSHTQMMIDQGYDVNHKCECGVTPLQLAILNMDLDSVNLLIQHGANVNAKSGNIDKVTPLMNAVLMNNESIVLSLLNAGAKVDEKCGMQRSSPLISATTKGYLECQRILIENGASVNQQWHNGETALSVAAQCGNVNGIELLIKHGASINEPDFMGKTPLLHAVAQQHVDCMKTLIDSGAMLDITDDSGADALLTSLIHHTDDICVLHLIQSGCSVNNVNREGMTALCLAAKNNRTTIIDALTKRAVNLNHCTRANSTALCYAAERNCDHSVRILLSAGADPNIGYPPLILAAIRRGITCIRMFLEAGANVNVVDSLGYTMIEIGAYFGNFEIVKIGLQAGAGIGIGNSGRSHRPTMYYNEEALMLLFAAGKECKYFNSSSAPRAIIETKRDNSLQNLCRSRIRKHFCATRPTENMFTVVPFMPIPHLMKKYLLYNISLNESQPN